MITRIRLNNWKSHLDSEISFSKGVNALIGIMGSGKTSVMQAIAFALFGTFSGISSRKLSLDDLIMSKPQPKESSSVELDFVLDGKTYTVKRTLDRGKGTGSAEIRRDGKLLEVNPKGVTSEVERILQMDYDLFQRAVYSEQNALDYFLQIPKGKRMQQIDSMLKLDRYEKAREAGVSIRNRILERRKEKLRTIEDMKERKFDERISALNEEMGKIGKEAEDLKSGVSKIEKRRRRLSERVVEYEAGQEMLNEIRKKEESLRSRVSEMERQMKGRRLKIKGMRLDKKSMERLSKDIAVLQARIDSRESEVTVLRERVSSKNGRIISLRDRIKEYRLRLSESKEAEMELKKLEKSLGENPEKDLEEMLKAVEGLKKRLYSLEARKKEMERGLAELKSAGDKCPVCESRLTKGRKKELTEHRIGHIGEMEMKVSEAEKRLSKESKKLESMRKGMERYREIKKSLDDIRPLRGKIKDSENEISLARKDVRKVASDIRRKEKEMKRLSISLEKARIKKERSEDLLEEKEEIGKLREEKEVIAKQLKSLRAEVKSIERKTKGRDIKSMRSELQEAVGLSRSAETKLQGLEDMLKEKTSVLKDLEEQRSTFLRYREEVSRYGKAIESMDSFTSVLRSTQDQLRDEFLKTVNYIMNDVWGELYPYGDFSEIRILVEKDYVLQMKGSRGWVNVEAVSGGERSLASLALRIAFSLAFTPNLRWLILDEPTHNLDANAIEHFGSVLKERMENIIDQVFLITHEDRLSDYITGNVYRLERDKDADGVTRIAAN